MKNEEVSSLKKLKWERIEGRGVGVGASLEKRRFPRWRLERVLFRSSLHGLLFSVVDLSEQGMSLFLESSEPNLWLPGLCLQGVMSVYSQKFPLQARIVSRRGNVLGCEFESLLESTQERLTELLRPESLGAHLKPVPFQDLDFEWWLGPCGTSVRFQRNKQQGFHQISIFLLGTYCHWEESVGWHTGKLISSSGGGEGKGVFRLFTSALQPDLECDSLKLSIAKKLILSSNLSESIKFWFNETCF